MQLGNSSLKEMSGVGGGSREGATGTGQVSDLFSLSFNKDSAPTAPLVPNKGG